MFCRKCGAKLNPEERFCPFCGQPVSEPVQASDQASPPPNQPHAPSQENRRDNPSTPPKMPKKKPLIIAVVSVVAVLAVAGTIAFFLSHRNPPDTAGQPSASQPAPSNSLPTAPSEHISESVQPEPSPSNTSTAFDTPSESASISTAPTSLSNLYIGTWAASGDTVGDETNGWQALYLESINGNSLTFSLESVQASPASCIASTYPITVTITNNSGTFPVNDSWGNSGTGTITISNNTIHIRVEITNPDPSAMWDVGMDTDFSPVQTSNISTPTPSSVPTAQPSPTVIPTGLGTTEEAITQEFVYQSTRHGASFRVDDTMFVGGDTTGMFQFDFGEEMANFGYCYDRSYGEISIGAVSNFSKLEDLANAAFLILCGNDESTGLKGLVKEVYSGEPTDESQSYYDPEAAEEYGDFYVETRLDTYRGTYTVDGYTCVFRLDHTYDAMKVGRSNDSYSGNIKFSKN